MLNRSVVKVVIKIASAIGNYGIRCEVVNRALDTVCIVIVSASPCRAPGFTTCISIKNLQYSTILFLLLTYVSFGDLAVVLVYSIC